MDRTQSLYEHLTELRRRIMLSVGALVVGIAAMLYFARDLFVYILNTARGGADVLVVQNSFADAFLTEFKLAVLGGLVLAFPVILYQIIGFVMPALHRNEKRILLIGLPFATLLFAAGWAFGWLVVVPITKAFFLSVSTSAGVQNQITPSAYLAFVLGICNPLGIAFELPLVVMILARIGLVTAPFLARIRKFAFLGIMVLAAVLSPPDIISMSIFLVPLYGLYEFSILLARFAAKRAE